MHVITQPQELNVIGNAQHISFLPQLIMQNAITHYHQ